MAKSRNRPRQGSPLNLPTARELFKPSYWLIRKHAWVFGPLYAVSFIFMAHSWLWSPLPGQAKHWWEHGDNLGAGWIGSTTPTFLTYSLVGFSILWFLLILVIGTVSQIMAQAAQLEAAEGQSPNFDRLWKVAKKLGPRMLGLYLVMGLVIGIGLVLLVIPGLMLLRRYIFAPYVMIEKNVGIREALDKSAALSKRNPGSVWGIIWVIVVITLVSFIPFVGRLISFFLSMFYSVAPALRYHQLKKLS